ncbi:MAG: hypothetical protein IJ341_09650 [Bacteroidales bacterium]|nr:hypothetical protein [Bacteroidales bacterium]
MSKNKNKGGKTASAKAARNLEALKKAKEAAVAAEKTAEVKETKVEEKKEEKAPEKKPTPAPKQTPYESYLFYKKHPHMLPLSHKIEKDSHGIENVHVVFKNSETNEQVSCVFPVSHVKEGDGIDIDRIKNGIKNPIPAGKEEKKEEPKQEEKKPTAKKSTKKEEKPIIPEVVEEPAVKTPKKPLVTIPQKDSNGDRIDANHGIELMRSFENRANELEKGTELHRAMREQADIMMFVYGKQWLDQCILDGDEAFLNVSEKMYNRLAIIGRDLLNLEVKALPVTSPTGEKQLKIDFKETIESAPEEVKKAIEADAKKENPSDTLPEADPSLSEEQKVKCIDSILRQKNGIGGNLHNAIQYTKNAFPEFKDACPAQVVAFIYSKIVTSTFLTGIANAIMGNVFGNGSIIASHAWLKQMMNGLDYNETEIANIVKVILANGLNKRGEYETLSKSCNKYIKQMNDDLINRIIAAKTPKEEANLKISGKYTELGTVQMNISSTKFINRIKEAYGADLSNKLLKQTMQRIMGLYSDGLKPLEVYVEKSAYVTKK